MPADPEIFTGDADRFPRNSGEMQQSPSLTTLRSFATCTGLGGRGRTLKRCRGSFACQAEGRLCMCLSLPVISVAESSVALLARLPSSVGRCRAAVYNCRQKFRVRKNSPVACAIRGRGRLGPPGSVRVPVCVCRRGSRTTTAALVCGDSASDRGVARMGLRDSQLHGPFRIFSGFGPNRGTQLAILSSFPTNPAPSRTAGTLRRSQASRPRLRPAASITNISMTIARNTYDHGHSAGLPG